MQTRVLLPLARIIATPAQSLTIFSSPLSTSSLLNTKQITNDQVYVDNQRINNLIKSGYLNVAVEVFEEMLTRDVVSFNLLIGAHGRNGFPETALNLYKNMVSQGVRENPSTFSSLLSICSNAGFHRQGVQVHCRVMLLGFSSNLYVGSALLDLYMQMRLPDVALKMFDEMPERNLATWNLILRGFCELGYVYELLKCFKEMKWEGFEGNGVSFSYVIHGCGGGKLLDEGKQVHCCVVKLGWAESDMFVENALVDFYSACGTVTNARKLFEVIQEEDVISWNSIISVSADNGFLLEACDLFSRMQWWGKKPSIRSFVGFLNLSSETGNLQFGKHIHSFVIKIGFDHGSIYVLSALIDMYGKCGKIESSISLFGEAREKSLECCNSLMTSLLHCGIVEDVIEIYRFMVDEAVGLDSVTFSATIKALTSSSPASSINLGLVHCRVIKSGLESDVVVSSSLIDAYSRSGHIQFPRKIFDQVRYPNLTCLTSIIAGYARNGMGTESLNMFGLLIEKGIQPDAITFLSVLTGCNYSGLVEEGLWVLKSMETVYKVQPDRRHYSCMVDLLGRAGLLEEAEEVLRIAEIKGDSMMWSSLLRSCRVHKNQDVGKRAAKALMELQPNDPAAYVQASNFYSEIGDMETASKVKEMRIRMNMKREFGYSFVETNNQVRR